jgi:hypothetical protein
VLSAKNIVAAGLILILFSCFPTEETKEPKAAEASPSSGDILPGEDEPGITPSSEAPKTITYPAFTIPEPRQKLLPYDISTENTGLRFTVPGSIKKEKIAFKALVNPPEIREQYGRRYVIVTAEEANVYTSPAETSKPLGTATAGEMFILQQEQGLPKKPEDLPRADYEKLRERFDLEWEFFLETYSKQPGVIVDGYYNTWIKVSNSRFKGWIFRAYTYESSYKNLLFLRELYKRGPVFSSYQDYVIGSPQTEKKVTSLPASSYYEGLHSRKQSLSPALKQALTSHYVVLEKVDAGMVSLSSARPDDMLSLYIDSAGSYLNPLFITTDLVIHTFFIIMRRAIAEIEENYFLPFIRRIMRYYFDRLSLYRSQITEEKMKKSADFLLGYFGMGLHLLGDLNEEDRSRCGFEVLQRLMNEASLLDGAAHKGQSPLLGKEIDYSSFDKKQYVHLSAEMQRYAMTLHWCSMLSFNPGNPDDTRSALLLAMFIIEDENALADYTFYSRAIAFLKGRSTGPTILTLINLIDTLDRNKIFSGISRDYIIKYVMETAAASFAPAADENLLMKEEAGVENEVLSPSITLFGSPLSLDGIIFTLLSHPHTAGRRKVQSLDLAASFGSGLAEKYLAPDMEDFDELRNSITEINQYIIHRKDEQWFEHYSDTLLMSIRQVLASQGKTGIPWFDSEGYRMKNLITFSGAYTESKQPLILEDTEGESYMGEFDFPAQYEYRMDPLPMPRGYIEPQYGFFHNLLLLYNTLTNHEAGKLLFCSHMAESLSTFFQEVEWMAFMVKNEKEGKTIDPFDYNHIFEIPELFARCCFPENFFYADEPLSSGCHLHRMAGLSTLYSAPFHQYVLTGCLGIPKRVYITIYDPDGGRRVCVGYTYAYFELWGPRDEVPAEQQWKTFIYSKSGKENKIPWSYEPSWARTEGE